MCKLLIFLEKGILFAKTIPAPRKERTPRAPLSPVPPSSLLSRSFHSFLGAEMAIFCWKHGRNVYKNINDK
jgi:hypothetical protein